MLVEVELDLNEPCVIKGADCLDLHIDPRAIERIEAARRLPALRTLLELVNASDSIFATISCKTWSTTEPEAPEAALFACRFDVIFLCEATNFGRGPHEDLAHRLAALLKREPGDSISAELRVVPVEFAGEDRGFGLRITLYARGTSEEQAKLRWALGLAHVQQALLFVARTLRQSSANSAQTEIHLN